MKTGKTLPPILEIIIGLQISVSIHACHNPSLQTLQTTAESSSPRVSYGGESGAGRVQR